MKRVVLFAVLILSFYPIFRDNCSGQTFNVQDYQALIPLPAASWMGLSALGLLAVARVVKRRRTQSV